jgi:hypothetical protein
VIRAVAFALAALVVSPGCSFLLIDRPPRPLPEQGHARCNVDSVLPIPDLVVFTGATVVTLFGTALSSIGSGRSERGAQVLGAVALGGGVFGVSGAYGLYQIERCRNARRWRSH